jgi:hypothetical protein
MRVEFKDLVDRLKITTIIASPDPEDAELIKKTMSLDERFGPTTLDLGSRLCWMRARIDDRWEPPTLIKVDYPAAVDDEVVQKVIREVIQAHRDDYVNPADWRDRVVDALKKIVPPEQMGLLKPLLKPKIDYGSGEDHDPDFWDDPRRNIGDLTYRRSGS